MPDWSLFDDLGTAFIRVVPRLVVAVLLGALIGYDRERHAKPAGLRTHMMVSLGSASFVLLAFEASLDVSGQHGKGVIDPTRVLQGVVGGIGFLGAGSIIQARGHVAGITTAASVWVCGAVGAACGAGGYVLASVTALTAFAILTIVAKLERWVRPPGEADNIGSTNSNRDV